MTTFQMVVNLIKFLTETDDKGAKVAEIKAAWLNGLLTKDEAIELVIEFC